MKPGICKIHGSASMTLTSPKIAAAIDAGSSFDDDLIVVSIQSEIGLNSYVVDAGFASDIFNDEPLRILIDRDKQERKLNDRLLIRKFISKMSRVCEKCLETATGRISQKL